MSGGLIDALLHEDKGDRQRLRKTRGLDVAVVGGGVAGVTAAYCLMDRHRVTLYERNDYLGGHTHTVLVEDPGRDEPIPVDTGFIVCNDVTYPTFLTLLKELGVETAATTMSFSHTELPGGASYASTGVGGFFPTKRQALSPAHWRMLLGIVRFRTKAKRDLLAGRVRGTLREYLPTLALPEATIHDHVLPMASAIWSSASQDALDFPAETFLRFYNNHGLLDLLAQVRWRYIPGGSHTYMLAFAGALRRAGGVIHLQSPVRAIHREAEAVRLLFDRGEARHDAVVVAAHADEALAMLADPDEAETEALGAWRYAVNQTTLHTDASFLPPARRTWACWNVTRETPADDPHPPRHVSVSYWMNRLQRLEREGATQDYVVTLNPRRPVPKDHFLAAMTYQHPGYDARSVASQKTLPHLNGRRRTFFCGSYFGYGFHEDGAKAGLAAAAGLGGRLRGHDGDRNDDRDGGLGKAGGGVPA